MHVEPVFVGREKELQQLGKRLDLMIGGQGQACFVTGEAGFGKTSLATEFARRAQRKARRRGEPTGPVGGPCHGFHVYDDLVRVPLVLSGPGVPAGGSTPDMVRHVDVGHEEIAVADSGQSTATSQISAVLVSGWL